MGTEADPRPLLNVSRVSFLRIVSLGMVIEEELLGRQFSAAVMIRVRNDD